MAPVRQTGFAYDSSMEEHMCKWDVNFLESPLRLKETYERIVQDGLLERLKCVKVSPIEQSKLFYVHTSDYINVVKSSESLTSVDELKNLSKQYEDVFFNEFTFKSACLAAGAVCKIMEAILNEEVDNGFALVRPPGHHAFPTKSCGFCFFNSVSVAAKSALTDYNLRRILIIDWDIHHGNGTQQIFYDDPRVLYISIHRYENELFWPHLRESDFDFIGKGKGLGFNINIPLNETGLQDGDYIGIFQQLIIPVVFEFDPQFVFISAGYDCAVGCIEFQPEFILISAGFDCAVGDIRGEMEVTPACFAHLIHSLSSLADGKLCVALEGGYFIPSLAESVVLTIRTLLGDPCPSLGSISLPSESVCQTIKNCISVLRPFWPCLRFHCEYPDLTFPLRPKDRASPFYHAMSEKLLEEKKMYTSAEASQYFDEFEKYRIQPPYPLSDEEPEYVPGIGSIYRPKEIDQLFFDKLNKIVINLDLTVPPNRTCITLENALMRHHSFHDAGHVERPERILHLKKRLHEENFINISCKNEIDDNDNPIILSNTTIDHQNNNIDSTNQGFISSKNRNINSLISSPSLRGRSFVYFDGSQEIDNEVISSDDIKVIAGRIASEEEILLCHTSEYLNQMKRINKCTRNQLSTQELQYNSVYLNKHSYDVARLAVGCVLEIVSEILSGASLNGFSLVRPPGHHAQPPMADGFCLFNNVAIAAKFAQREFDLRRILIVDFDAHHGQGTQEIFYEDERVLYISVHVFLYGRFFPCDESGNYNYCGEGKGKGFNVNIPWNKTRMGDVDYIAVFQQIIMPIAYSYNPEFVLVSAGFDAAVGDPLGMCRVSSKGFAHMTHMLRSLAGGKILLVLEGGYNLISLAESALSCLRVLLGNPPPGVPFKSCSQGCIETMRTVLQFQKNFWPCLNSTAERILPDSEAMKSRLLALDNEASCSSNCVPITKPIESSETSDRDVKLEIPEFRKVPSASALLPLTLSSDIVENCLVPEILQQFPSNLDKSLSGSETALIEVHSPIRQSTAPVIRTHVPPILLSSLTRVNKGKSSSSSSFMRKSKKDIIRTTDEISPSKKKKGLDSKKIGRKKGKNVNKVAEKINFSDDELIEKMEQVTL